MFPELSQPPSNHRVQRTRCKLKAKALLILKFNGFHKSRIQNSKRIFQGLAFHPFCRYGMHVPVHCHQSRSWSGFSSLFISSLGDRQIFSIHHQSRPFRLTRPLNSRGMCTPLLFRRFSLPHSFPRIKRPLLPQQTQYACGIQALAFWAINSGFPQDSDLITSPPEGKIEVAMVASQCCPWCRHWWTATAVRVLNFWRWYWNRLRNRPWDYVFLRLSGCHQIASLNGLKSRIWSHPLETLPILYGLYKIIKSVKSWQGFQCPV
jgi:hypothetical protein